MEEKAKMVAEVLKLLANEHRLLILCALAGGPKTVNEIVETVNSVSQSQISQYLGMLRSHKIVEASRKAQNVIYRICDSRIVDLMVVLKDTYCKEA